MDVKQFLAGVQTDPRYAGQLAHVASLPSRTAEFGAPANPLHPLLQSVLASRGLDQLYVHQVDALELARQRRDWVVVTGTASGKTLCYNLPILEACLADPEARALYLFPTKALAQDQLRGQLELLQADPELAARVKPGVFDGDTPTAQRRRIKAEANLILSNPDMLHASILPYHPKWSRVFEQLQFVVLDEVHTYRGILGANVACVLRRLRRVCEHYGSNPVFLCASATVANPGELASRLIGRDIAVIDRDGSPRGAKYFALWNPSPFGKDSLARRSATDDAVWLMTSGLEAGAQVLAFTRTRQAAELVTRYAQDDLTERRSPLADRVRTYRGGYLPNDRRKIESEMADGKLRGIAATNALELGIDIGSLDVALLVNYPGTIASTWQQAGRSGRRHDESLAVLMAGNDPVDQYLLRHPEYFFAQSPEQAVVDPGNPYVLANHLKAAAFELPLDLSDVSSFGPGSDEIAQILCDEDELSSVAGKVYFSGGQNPAQRFSLRHMSDNTFSIVLCQSRRSIPAATVPDRSGFFDALRDPSPLVPPTTEAAGKRRQEMSQEHQVIANVDAISAPELIYPEAVYLHHGETYFIRSLDWEGRVAYAERQEMDYYTQAILESRVLITETRDTSSAIPAALLGYGKVDVSWQTTAFKKIKFETRENVGYGRVDLPAQHLPTTAFWLVPDDSVRAQMKTQKLRTSEALCGLRNLIVQVLPMVAMCDSRDISGLVDSQNLGKSTMIVYDRYPGGLGYCEKGYHFIRQLLELCQQMVTECPCEDGCPSCVGLPNLRPAIHSDPDLSRGYPIPDKQATVRLLELLSEVADESWDAEHAQRLVTSQPHA